MKINLRDNSVQKVIDNLSKVIVILKVGETKIGVSFNNVFYVPIFYFYFLCVHELNNGTC